MGTVIVDEDILIFYVIPGGANEFFELVYQ